MSLLISLSDDKSLGNSCASSTCGRGSHHERFQEKAGVEVGDGALKRECMGRSASTLQTAIETRTGAWHRSMHDLACMRACLHSRPPMR
eukprot:4925-Chlamydomonas_euryale.AAC.1